MRLTVIQTKETTWELPDNYFDGTDLNINDMSDCELASEFQCEGKLISEDEELKDIEWSIRSREDK